MKIEVFDSVIEKLRTQRNSNLFFPDFLQILRREDAAKRGSTDVKSRRLHGGFASSEQ